MPATKARGTPKRQHCSINAAWRERAIIPFPVFGLLQVALWYAPLTHAWLAQQEAGQHPWPCGDEGRSGQTAGSQQKNLTRQRATVFSRNQRMQQSEHGRHLISNTGLPLFSKHRQGNNMANSLPENFHGRCSQWAPIPHPSAPIRVGPPSVDAAPPGI